MNWDRIKDNWKKPELKSKVKEQWGKLTDEDIAEIAGKRDQLEGRIQERYHIDKNEAEREVKDWLNTIVAHHDYKPPRR